MARNKFIRMYTKLTGAFTTGELVAREIAFEESSNSLVTKKSDNTILRFGTGNSFTPQPYQSSPTLTTLRDALVASGVMSAQLTYTVSGVISGDSPVGVDLALVGTNTYNTTSGVGGIFNLTGVPDGSYVLTPTKAGYSFTPLTINVNVSGANVTAQNFVSAEASMGQNVSNNTVIVPSSTTVRAVQKSPRQLDTSTFPAISSLVYMPTFNGSARWFLPQNGGNVYVYERVALNNFTLRQTIAAATHGAGTVFRIHFSAGKYCMIGSSGIRFGTYNEGTDTWTNGTFLSNEVYPLDSVIDTTTNKIYISSQYLGAPNRNVTVLNHTSETVTDRQTVAGSSTLSHIAVGNTGLLVVANDGTSRLVDKTTFATIGGALSFANQAGAIAYSRSKFWLTQQTNATLRSVDEATGTAATPQSGLLSPSGVVADADFVYIAEQSGNRITVINATTGAIDGSSVTGITSPLFTTS